MPDLDHRLNAYRDDLADISLEGKVDAKKFVKPHAMQVTAHFADLKSKPDSAASLDAQVLHGDVLNVFEQSNGWAWVQSTVDNYVGYVRDHELGDVGREPTHLVLAPHTFLYPEPDMKSARCGYHSMGSKLIVTEKVTTRGTDFCILDSGEAIIAKHIFRLGDWRTDFVSVAETLINAPYLWGGNTGFGVDCSGMISLAFRLCGKTVFRDTDMQANSIGEELTPQPNYSNLQRGDLVFWNGHVGVMAGKKYLLHANGNSMNVALEPLKEAVERIAYLYGKPTIIRRP
ncbi:MAG: peptidase P60 [Hyphomicrobiales bacterium]|nr:MAG: peptidase P60 [Hyphomicrobiales bacterium]